MSRQTDYHLAHTRAVASGTTGGAQSSVKDSADGLAQALLRLHAAQRITIDVQVTEDVIIGAQREDVDEMLGNLLANDCKWARAAVVVSVGEIQAREGGPLASPARVTIIVDDDGDGIAPHLRNAVLERGMRADQSVPGSGLGLAIVRDLAELYGGSIRLDASPQGGLRVQLSLRRGESSAASL